MALCMCLSLYLPVQNEASRIVFTKPIYAVSLHNYFAVLFGVMSALCFILNFCATIILTLLTVLIDKLK